ncbi:hypothetical protein IU485_27780 [Nocardia cyriacigeorgica]|uniref:hypothetical protein n=1 Tax=Nocardia cyriacigeorgica TaxID=135487 RepID=UPI001895A69A|nr:hypothetical protein [Nocardia cyriacigeorgica]MBF6085178.1 hypothetical protein [Nocardia cyriacigeorgica]
MAIATARVRDIDPGLTPVAVEALDDAVMVVLDSSDKRFTVIVTNRDGEWLPPQLTSGTPRRVREREPSTRDVTPLYGPSRRWFAPSADASVGWFAVTGSAALDAEEITVSSELESRTFPVHPSGLAFGVVRAARGEQPRVEVRTRGGRSVLVRP